MFRFNHPKEAAKLREKRKVRGINLWRFSIKHMTCLLIYLLFLFSRAACSPVWAYPCLICPNPVKTSLQSCCITLGKPPRVCVCVCVYVCDRASGFFLPTPPPLPQPSSLSFFPGASSFLLSPSSSLFMPSGTIAGTAGAQCIKTADRKLKFKPCLPDHQWSFPKQPIGMHDISVSILVLGPYGVWKSMEFEGSHDPSEIIIICLFASQETFIVIKYN